MRQIGGNQDRPQYYKIYQAQPMSQLKQQNYYNQNPNQNSQVNYIFQNGQRIPFYVGSNIQQTSQPSYYTGNSRDLSNYQRSPVNTNAYNLNSQVVLGTRQDLHHTNPLTRTVYQNSAYSVS